MTDINDTDIVKKKDRRKDSLKIDGQIALKKTFPILVHIVLSNGSVVEIPRLPFNSLELTSYENLCIALESVGRVISCLSVVEPFTICQPKKYCNLQSIQINLEDSMNHLYSAIANYPQSKGVS